jgi:hypothetical protein
MTQSYDVKYLSDDHDYFFSDLPEVEYKVSEVKIINKKNFYWVCCNTPCKEFFDTSIKCIGCNLCLIFGCLYCIADQTFNTIKIPLKKNES